MGGLPPDLTNSIPTQWHFYVISCGWGAESSIPAVLLFFDEGMFRILDFFFDRRSSMALIVLSMMPISWTLLAKKAEFSMFSSAHSSNSSKSRSCIFIELRLKSKFWRRLLPRGFLKLLRFGWALMERYSLWVLSVTCSLCYCCCESCSCSGFGWNVKGPISAGWLLCSDYLVLLSLYFYCFSSFWLSSRASECWRLNSEALSKTD